MAVWTLALVKHNLRTGHTLRIRLQDKDRLALCTIRILCRISIFESLIFRSRTAIASVPVGLVVDIWKSIIKVCKSFSLASLAPCSLAPLFLSCSDYQRLWLGNADRCSGSGKDPSRINVPLSYQTICFIAFSRFSSSHWEVRE